MNLRKNALTALSLGTLLTVFAAPALAQQKRCAVPPERAQQLILANRQHRAEKTKNGEYIQRLDAWCQNHWKERRTVKYQKARARIQSLKQRQNWLDHYIHQNRAEYYGWNGGFVANGGMNGSTGSTHSTTGTRNTTGGIDLLNQNTNRRRPASTPQSGTNRGTPNYGGIDLLNQRAGSTGSHR